MDDLAPESRLERWSLTRIPNYHNALPVETVAADAITELEFRRDFVDKNTPCLLRGAARHWPAFQKWKSLAYLQQTTTRYAAVSVNYEPVTEHGDDDEQENGLQPYVRFHDFLNKLANANGFIRGIGQIAPRSGFAGMLPDLGTFPFLSSLSGSRMYQTYRFLMSRKSYTHWHWHPTDETLMTQVCGSKEILLLPPDDVSWNALTPVANKHDYFDVEIEAVSESAQFRPYRAIAHAGDALYVPVYWWHAVESLESDVGITVPATWGSPLHVLNDMRFPAARAEQERAELRRPLRDTEKAPAES